MRSMRTLRQKRRSSTKLGSKNCVTIFGAEFGSAAAECGPIRKKLWRQPDSWLTADLLKKNASMLATVAERGEIETSQRSYQGDNNMVEKSDKDEDKNAYHNH